MGGKNSGFRTKDPFMDFAPGRPPYDRQLKESDPAWEAFSCYKTLSSERSCSKVAKSLGKSNTLMEGWSRQWNWRFRVVEWDRAQDSVQRQAHFDAIVRKTEEMANVAEGMWRIAGKSLAHWHEYLVWAEKHHPPSEGKRPKISAKETQMLADAGIKLFRLMLDQPTDISKHNIDVSVDDQRMQIQKVIGNSDVRKAMELVSSHLEEAKTEGFKQKPEPKVIDSTFEEVLSDKVH